MSYNQGTYKRPAWIGITVAVVLGLWFFGGPLRNAGERARLSGPAGFEAELLRDPQAGELFKTIKTTNPEEMADFVEVGARMMARGASREEMAAHTVRLMQMLQRDVPTQLAVAPHAELVAAVRAQAAMMEKARATDVASCASLASTGAFDGAHSELRASTTATSIARLRAAAAGRDHPQAGAGKLTAEDVRMLSATMRKNGLGESDVETFNTATDMRGTPPRALCDITYHSYRAVLEMPEAAGDRLMRWMLGP